MMRLVAALSFAAVLVGAAASGAMAQELACGAEVTSDVTLDASLSGCSTGLVVGADGITIDLNGYSIEGVGEGVGIWSFDRSNVTIRNGYVRGFHTGVTVSGAGSKAEAMSISDSSVGIRVGEAFDTRVVGNSLTNNSDTGISCHGQTSGAGPRIHVEGNRAVGNGMGMEFDHCSANFINNVASENHSHGIRRDQSYGLVEGNTANDNGGSGIASFESHADFIKNVTNGNVDHGLLISDVIPDHGPYHSLTRNLANANGGYGIVASFGFGGPNPFPGVIDGGKNRAHANQGAAQCLGVVCNGGGS
jgi:hypothetical protein